MPDRAAARTWRARAVSTLWSLLLLAGCGGGGGTLAGVGSGGTGAYASGPITGFGSVIVNGVHYDERDARIEDDDGAARGRDDLRLGMTVEVVSGPVTNGIGGPSAGASSVRYRSALKGPVASVDPVGASMVVFGQIVRVTATTVYESSLAGGLAAVSPGDVIEVYATYDAAAQAYVATRVDLEDAVPSAYKLRGIVGALDTGAKTFRIGSQTFAYGGLAPGAVPATLADGADVRVQVQTTPSGGRWVVTRLDDGVRRPDDGDEAEIEGRISAFTSAASFSVDGVPVNASGAVFAAGSAGLALGVRVEVEGSVSGGVLVARKVALESDAADEGDDERIELDGTLSALDAGVRTFVLRGVTVRYGGDVGFDGGVEADLANGRRVEVKGALADDGVTVQATRIVFDG